MRDSRRRPINEFERVNLYLTDLLSRVDAVVSPIEGWEYRTGRHLAPGKYEYTSPWRPYSPDILWGGEDATAWFRATVKVSASMKGREVTARLVPGGEGILSVNGTPVCGVDYNHREYILTLKAAAGQEFALGLECYFRDAPDDSIRNEVRRIHKFEIAQLVVKDRDLLALYYDLSSALDMAKVVESKRADLAERLMKTIHAAIALMDPYATSAAAYRKGAIAARRLLAQRLYDGGHDRPEGTLELVGHSHLDLYYVWPYRESVRKNMRTDLIAADLLKRYSNYTFTQSQAKLFADMKRFHPREFAIVKDLVRKGRFQPVGDMWTETDCNIACGEALARQILYGKKFFEKELKSRSTICWLSDVFGAAGSLPQLLAQGEFRLFYTTKHSIWFDTNEFPHNTFWWEGIDGTRLMAHIPPTHFVGAADPESLLLQWDLYREKTEAPHVIYTYGFGDGGGGPTEKMLEYAERFARMDGMPRIRFTRPEEFVDRLVASAHDLPVWADELYLEMHRGVQTTKGQLKRKNRQAEAGLRAAEILSSLAAILTGSAVPSRDLEGMWKLLIEMHFHDAITGTHCTEAGREIDAAYDRLISWTDGALAEACGALAARKKPGAKTLVNLTGTVTAGHVFWRHDGAKDVTLSAGREAMVTQRLADGRLMTRVDGLPALGAKAFSVVPRKPSVRAKAPLKVAQHSLVSPHYSLRFGADGRIEALTDLDEKREVIAGPANAFHLYEDKPGRFEAWEIAKEYKSRPIDAVRFERFEEGQCGPLLASKVLKWRVGGSALRQEVILYAHSRRIDFVTEVDWREERKLLQVEFPFALLAKRATYEIPFGTIERVTKPVSPYDKAKFDVAFQRWFDVGEHGYGVAVLNNGKYGGCVRDAVATLSLLKAPRFPDPTSDLGLHEFTYSLLPHKGDWRTAGVFEEAVLLNTPLILADGAAAGKTLDYVTVSRPGIAVEALKKAENGRGWVIRLVDYFGQSGPVTVTLPGTMKTVEACTILEKPNNEPVAVSARAFTYACRPFGIQSFRVTFKA